jgi:hypothetical protein
LCLGRPQTAICQLMCSSYAPPCLASWLRWGLTNFLPQIASGPIFLISASP